ncbi:TSUP family transporter [Microbacterium sp. CIAB417]|uniref:TSUP family transporter n=1 Tax=Microbacterium sp. CIAB417 TaxID=2860287 RepID=UPI001FAB3ED2|nr:TSUP family transporter [Microbacterium sp. CIAB417]
MILLFAGAAAAVAAVIQRLTGLAFVLVLIGPAVLIYGAVEGVTVAVLLSVVAALVAVPSGWRLIDWPRTLWLLGAGIAAAPFGVLVTRVLPEAALLLLIAGLGIIALLTPRFGGPAAAVLKGRRGALYAGATAGFLHASSGLSGPALAAYALGDRWEQRRFAASAQVVFLGYGAVSVLLRGLPAEPAGEMLVLSTCTAVGIVAGAALTRVVPVRVARAMMLSCAWAGIAVTLVRGVLALAG